MSEKNKENWFRVKQSNGNGRIDFARADGDQWLVFNPITNREISIFNTAEMQAQYTSIRENGRPAFVSDEDERRAERLFWRGMSC